MSRPKVDESEWVTEPHPGPVCQEASNVSWHQQIQSPPHFLPLPVSAARFSASPHFSWKAVAIGSLPLEALPWLPVHPCGSPGAVLRPPPVSSIPASALQTLLPTVVHFGFWDLSLRKILKTTPSRAAWWADLAVPLQSIPSTSRPLSAGSVSALPHAPSLSPLLAS